ncbi:rhodanese-like domain-containing protein [candidate division KSB1 bacterium]|nr:rhodanese-like domain-containing protein [candidate division KSB1 bacterium]
MLKKVQLYVLSLLIIFVFSCSKDENPVEPKTVDEFGLVTAVGDQYFTNYTTTTGGGINLSIADLFVNLTDGNAGNDPFIIDYRSGTDFASGHIKGAVNIAITDLVTKIDDGTIPNNKTILNVCYTGQTASYATCVLALLGYEAQNLLFGMCGVTTDTTINGTANWSNQIAEDEFAANLTATVTTVSTEKTFPVLATGQSDASSIIKEQFKTVMGGAGWGRISATDVFVDPNKYFIINYWPQEEYINPGHIPGSYCFPPKASLGKEQMLKYLPTDKTIVIYCYTGQTSAQVAAYLQILGYDAKSLLYGVNGFAYNMLTKSKYTAPVNDYSAIIEK